MLVQGPHVLAPRQRGACQWSRATASFWALSGWISRGQHRLMVGLSYRHGRRRGSASGMRRPDPGAGRTQALDGVYGLRQTNLGLEPQLIPS